MAAAKMTREAMIERLNSITVGSKMVWQGKTYTVIGIRDCGGKLCRRDIGILEDGKPETYEVPGKYLAAGRMIQFSNIKHRSLLAQKMYMDFEIVGQA